MQHRHRMASCTAMDASRNAVRQFPTALRMLALLVLSLFREGFCVQTLQAPAAPVHHPELPAVNKTLSLIEWGKAHRESLARVLQPWGKVHRHGPAQRPTARKHPEVWEARISSGPVPADSSVLSWPGSPLTSLVGTSPATPAAHKISDVPLTKGTHGATALAVANAKHGLAAHSKVRAAAPIELGKVAPPPSTMKEYCHTPPPKPDGPCPFILEDEVLVNWEGKGHWYAAKITYHANNDTHEAYSVIYHDGRMEMGLNCTRLSKGRNVGAFHTKEWVEAMWSGYDKWYTARVTAANNDGTYNLIYKDDGMLEDSVPLDRIRKIKNAEGAKTDADKNDPVCQMVETFSELQSGIDGAHGKVSQAIRGPEASIANLQNLGPPKFSSAGELQFQGFGGAGPAPAPGAASIPRKKSWLKNHLGKAAERLTDKYGGLEAAMKAGDTNGDGLVSVPEMIALLEDLGIPAAEAKALSEALLHKFGPNGAPVADAALHMQNLLGDDAALDSAVEDMVASMNPPTFPDNMMEGDPEAMKARIKQMRAELFGRTSELTQRYVAMGNWPPELQKLKAQDEARMLSGLPLTEEEMQNELDWLQGEIWDRANRLEEELNLENNPDMLAGNSQQLMDGIEVEVVGINKLSQQLEDRMKKLSKQGKLDPELEFAMKKLLGDAAHMKNAWRGGAAGQEDGHNGVRNTNAFGVNLDLLGADLFKMKADLSGLTTGVLPIGAKWWRYRWEYSFVESWIIVILCLLASFWTKIYNLVRARLGREMLDTPLFVEEYLPHVALATWLRYFMAVLVVLHLVVITLWMLARLGLFDLWIAVEYAIVEGINLPTESEVYVTMAWDIASQLAVAMIMFYLLTLQICFRALRNDRDCKNLEENRVEALRHYPVSPVMIGKFATEPDEYAALKQGWFEGIAHRCSELTPRGARTEAQKLRYVLEQRGVMSLEHQDKFPLWYFISQRVRKGVEKTFMIDSLIWLIFAGVFWCFSMLHYFAQIAYIRISIALSIVSLLGFIYMIHVVRKMSSVHDDSMSIRLSPMTVVCLFQFPLFFLCFVATRLMLSTYLWTLFTSLSFGVLAVVVVFFIIFPMFIAPLVVTYLIKTSFPPHTNDAVALIETTLDEYELAEKREELKRRTRYELWTNQGAVPGTGPYAAPCGIFRPCPDSAQVASPQARSPTVSSMYPGGPGGYPGSSAKAMPSGGQEAWGSDMHRTSTSAGQDMNRGMHGDPYQHQAI